MNLILFTILIMIDPIRSNEKDLVCHCDGNQKLLNKDGHGMTQDCISEELTLSWARYNGTAACHVGIVFASTFDENDRGTFNQSIITGASNLFGSIESIDSTRTLALKRNWNLIVYGHCAWNNCNHKNNELFRKLRNETRSVFKKCLNRPIKKPAIISHGESLTCLKGDPHAGNGCGECGSSSSTKLKDWCFRSHHSVGCAQNENLPKGKEWPKYLHAHSDDRSVYVVVEIIEMGRPTFLVCRQFNRCNGESRYSRTLSQEICRLLVPEMEKFQKYPWWWFCVPALVLWVGSVAGIFAWIKFSKPYLKLNRRKN